MLKKIFSLVIIALMLFSFVAGVSAQNNYISIYSKTQDNDGDGIITVYNKDNQLMYTIPILKGETKFFSLRSANRIIFHSKGRSSYYDAGLGGLREYWNCQKYDNIDIHVEVNFYKKSMYYNKFYIDKTVVDSNRYEYGRTYAPFQRDFKYVICGDYITGTLIGDT